MSFKYPTTPFCVKYLLQNKTYRMGFLCIPVCSCISSFSRDSQGCRFPCLHRESFSIHNHSVFMHNAKGKSSKSHMQLIKGHAIKLSKFEPLVLSFILKQETVILHLHNNDIINCGMMQKKKSYAFHKSLHLLKSP